MCVPARRAPRRGCRGLASLGEPDSPASPILFEVLREVYFKRLLQTPGMLPNEAPWPGEEAEARSYSGLCNSLTGWPLPKLSLAEPALQDPMQR